MTLVIGKWKLAIKYSFFRTYISVKTEIDMTPLPVLAYVHILMTVLPTVLSANVIIKCLLISYINLF